MAAEVKYHGKPPQQRIADRLRNSGQGRDTNPDVTVQKGDGPGRTFTNIHHSASHGTMINPNPQRQRSEKGID